MFTLTKKEYEEIVALISKFCCPCTGRHGHCAELECDVQFIYEILRDHLEKGNIESDKEEICIEWSGNETDISNEENKLPFRE